MADSVEVLGMLKLVYTIYALIAISLVGWYAYKLVQVGEASKAKPMMFWTYVTTLVIVGTGLHFLTYNVVPWVPTDLDRANLSASKTFSLEYENHQIKLSENPIKISCKEKVVFDATSNDLTYGFGIFRQNNTMVTQMQVVPNSNNDLMWEFHKNGVYHIRSTEYSGPKGSQMILENAIIVSGCEDDDKYSMNAEK